MPSLILISLTRYFFPVMLIGSIFVLLRGHNDPGGGFVGGLLAALAFAVVALAFGVADARRRLRVHPIVLVGIGVLLGFLSGLPGLFLDVSYLQHQWTTLYLGPIDLKLGTTLIFDLGVYFVVLGGILAFLFRLYEEDAS